MILIVQTPSPSPDSRVAKRRSKWTLVTLECGSRDDETATRPAALRERRFLLRICSHILLFQSSWRLEHLLDLHTLSTSVSTRHIKSASLASAKMELKFSDSRSKVAGETVIYQPRVCRTVKRELCSRNRKVTRYLCRLGDWSTFDTVCVRYISPDCCLRYLR